MVWTEPESGETAASLGDADGFKASPASLGVTATDDMITIAVAAASNILRRLANGQTISQLSETITLDGHGVRTIYLPEQPVTDVSAVSVDGTDWVECTDYAVDLPTGSVIAKAAQNYRFPYGPGRIQITYTHGYETVPDDVVQVVYRIARRLITSPDGAHISEESLGGYRVSYYDRGATEYGLTDVELSVVEDLRNPARMV